MEKQLLECVKREDGRWMLTVRVAPAEFSQTLEVVYQLCKDQLEIEGVEKGQATREQAEAAMGKDFFYPQAAQQCCAQSLKEIVEEQKLPVVGYPDVEKCSTDEEGLIFTAIYDEYPTAKLGDYKKIRVHLPEPTVEEGEVTALLEQYARRAAKHIELDRPAQEGDTLHIDLEGTLEGGSPVPGGKAEDYAIKVGSHTLLPQLEEGMIGMKAGETKDITLTFPKEYAEELAGKTATFHVTVNAVCQVEIPVVDETFAKTFFEVDMATLRAEVKASVLQDKMAEYRAKVAEAALSQASGQMDCLLPESMIQKEIDDMMVEFGQRLDQQGISLDKYLEQMKMSEEEFARTARSSAVHRLRLDVLLKEVAKAEGLVADERATRRTADIMAEQYGSTTDVVLQALTPEMLERETLRRMVVDVILGK
ncbi:MAG: trigger factor [Clostridia bacterium]|nr:trigger factor [Clostridia bacterium]